VTAAPRPDLVASPVVLLRRPSDAGEIDEERAAELQRGHLAYLESLHSAGHLLVWGPCGDQEDESLRGICLFRAGLALDEVRRMASEDPSVQAGRLAVEAFTWWTLEGKLAVRS
jgi:uncharacterized protein